MAAPFPNRFADRIPTSPNRRPRRLSRARTGGGVALALVVVLVLATHAGAATVTGEVVLPESDMGWTPSLYEYAAKDGARVRVQGTTIAASVVPAGPAAGTFAIAGVPAGRVTLQFDEGPAYDVFTQASKRVEVDVNADTVGGLAFSLVYHWDELVGYPPPWDVPNTQGPAPRKAQFIGDQVAFVMFRRDVPSERVELYRTTDRGAHWDMVGQWIFDPMAWSAGARYPLHWTNFHFLDADRGVVHATRSGIPCDPGDAYFWTADGGMHWQTTPLPLTPTGYHVQASAYARIGDGRLVMAGRVGCGVQGYDAGAYDAIWESPDAGATWTLAWHSARDEWGTFIGVDANAAGRAVAYRGVLAQQFLLRDPLGVWTPHPGGGIRNDSRDVAMVGDMAWLVSQGGAAPDGVHRSADAGATWSRVSTALMQDFDFATPLKGFGQAGGPAHVTYDGGVTWRYQAAGGAVWPGTMDVWAFDRTRAAWSEGGFSDPNGKTQLFTYVEPWLPNFEVLPHAPLADATVARGAAGVAMASWRLIANGPVPIHVRSLTLRAAGTGDDATDVGAVALWRDTNADGALDAGDPLLDRAVFDADDGAATLVIGPAHTLEQLVPLHLLVTYDLSAAIRHLVTFRPLLEPVAVDAVAADTGAAVAASAPAGTVLASRTVTVPADADLAVAMTAAPDPVAAGAPLTYRIVVTNGGPDAAAGVRVSDALPAGTALVSMTPTQGACAEAGGVVRCALGEIAPGASAGVELVVTPGVAGVIENTAVAGAVEIDPAPENNAATVRTTVAAVEACGNCVDDDGNGLADFEDPACCGTVAAGGLVAKRLRIKPGRGSYRFLLAGRLAGGAGTPVAEDVVLQLRQAAGEVLCARLPAAVFARRRKGLLFSDRKGRVTGARGLAKVLLVGGRKGGVTLRAQGTRVALGGPAAGALRVTLAFSAAGGAAGRCAAAQVTLAAGKRGALRASR